MTPRSYKSIILLVIAILSFQYAHTQVFNSPVIIDSSVNGPRSVDAADLDLDGDIDLVVAAKNADLILWYENDGMQNFTKHTFTSLINASMVRIADVNEDGSLDIIASNDASGGTIVWYDFSTGTSNNIGQADGLDYGLSQAEVNGSLVDIFSASINDDDISWFINDGSGGFSKTILASNQQDPDHLEMIDLDSDGDVDLVYSSTVGDAVYWIPNNGSGFVPNSETQLLTLNGAYSLAIEDFDGDSDLDILAGSDQGTATRWFRNNGDGTFNPSGIYVDCCGSTVDMEIGDFDVDGDIDLVTGVVGTGYFVFYINDSNGNFTQDLVTGGLSGIRELKAIDIDSDGDLDVIATAYQEDQVILFENITDPVSTETDILSYSLTSSLGQAIIDLLNHSITLQFSEITDVSSLVGTFTLSSGASASISSVNQESGVTANDFSQPVVYTITAEDGITTQDWTVTLDVFSADTDIISYSIPGQESTSVIDAVARTVNLGFPGGTDLSNLIADFTLSSGASATISTNSQQSGTTFNDFNVPITYTITAEDGITSQDWLVTVTQEMTISSHSPQSGEELNIDGNISITFSDPIDVLTLPAGISISTSSGSISGIWQVQGNTVIFSPDNDLIPDETITVQVTSSVANPEGNKFGPTYSWNFTIRDFNCSDLAGSGIECDPITSRFSVAISDDFAIENDKLIINPLEFSLFEKIGTSQDIEFTGGAVKIGNTSVPQGYKLAVDGNVIASRVRVDDAADGWPDYVFEEDYDLKTLEEVNQYIKDNGHLPEIPSASEVEENGIELGEMNASLLKKIEELTLYLIHQFHTNLDLKNQVEVLSEQNQVLLKNQVLLQKAIEEITQEGSH